MGSKTKTNRARKSLVLVTVCVASGILGFTLRNGGSSTAKGRQPLSEQLDDKLIQNYEREGSPVVLSNLRVRGVRVIPGHKFSAATLAGPTGDQAWDWLENLEFKLENASDKKIVFIHLELEFPDTEVSGPRMVYRDLGLGIPSSGAAAHPSKYDKPLLLEPGAATIFRLSDTNLKDIKAFLALRGFELAQMNAVAIQVLSVNFDNGLKWGGGFYYRQNPAAPGGYERIDALPAPKQLGMN